MDSLSRDAVSDPANVGDKLKSFICCILTPQPEQAGIHSEAETIWLFFPHNQLGPLISLI